MRRYRELWILLIVAAGLKILLMQRSFFPWWDFGVYLGMGKFIFSLGSSGLWEPIRPVLWPLVLGIFWKLGLDPIFWTRTLTFLLSLGITVMVYLIAEQLLNRKTAILSAVMATFSGFILIMSVRTYTGIPAIFLILISFYLIIKKRYFFGGAVVALAALTKFTAGIFIPLFLVYILKERYIKKKIPRGAFIFTLGSAIPLLPYLIFNWFAYGSPIFPFVEAQRIISTVLSCNVLHQHGLWFYPLELIKDNPLFLLAIPGAYLLWKNRSPAKVLLIFAFLIPFIYHLQLGCRIARYVLIFLPFLIIIAAYGIERISKRLDFRVIIASVLIISVPLGIILTLNTLGGDIENEFSKGYYSYPSTGEVWTSNPLVSIYSESRLNKIYYPVFDADLSSKLLSAVEAGTPDMVYLDNCGGGIICPPGDHVCGSNLETAIGILEQDYDLVYDENYGRCYYKVFTRHGIS